MRRPCAHYVRLDTLSVPRLWLLYDAGFDVADALRAKGCFIPSDASSAHKH